jgi:formylglycine-generating enzyme required for sulfatase activity
MGEDMFYGNALVDSYFTVKFPDSGLMPVSCPQRIYCQNLVDKYAKLPHYFMSYCINPSCSAPAKNSNDTNFCITCGASLRLKDRYRAQKLLGQGGFGKTFKAVDEDRPGQPLCVIKQFAYSNSDPKTQQMALNLFYEEAKHLQSLGSHPQIPELLAYFDVDGQPYLVQQYIDGQDLEKELATEGAFNQQKIRELLESLLPVLDFLHNQPKPVIHRDIKPANIIRQRADGVLILVDFGAAKQATQTMLAKTGTMIGSPEFAAPEQTRGKPAFASDIYSLGVTCIHLLTNVPPFDLFDIGEDNWVWRDYLVNNPVDKLLGEVLDGSIVNALARRYRSASDVLIALSHKIKSTAAPLQPNYFLTPIVSNAPQRKSVIHDTFTFETAQLKKFSRQVVAVRTVKKLGWLGLTSEEVEESYNKTIDEWRIQKNSGQAKRFIEDIGNGVKLEMVAIPGGEFLMGAPVMEKESSPDEKPQHQVNVSSFHIGRYSVTQDQYTALMGVNPSYFKGKDLPVESVSWRDAQTFCRNLSRKTGHTYRLPSEAEWEYACRAGTTTPFAFGETITPDVANYNSSNYTSGTESRGKYLGKTSAVGSFRLANNLGLYDMHGNVQEWCEDTWHDNYQNAPNDGSAWVSENDQRLLRGGAWDYYPRSCRTANRGRWSESSRSHSIGFRVVCNQDL